jgi:hypothetical protein
MGTKISKNQILTIVKINLFCSIIFFCSKDLMNRILLSSISQYAINDGIDDSKFVVIDSVCPKTIISIVLSLQRRTTRRRT